MKLDVEAFWNEFTEFETSQVVKFELTEEEKKGMVKQRLMPFFEAHTKAVAMYASVNNLMYRAKKRQEFWSSINMEHFAMRQSDEEECKAIYQMKKAIAYAYVKL